MRGGKGSWVDPHREGGNQAHTGWCELRAGQSSSVPGGLPLPDKRIPINYCKDHWGCRDDRELLCRPEARTKFLTAMIPDLVKRAEALIADYSRPLSQVVFDD